MVDNWNKIAGLLNWQSDDEFYFLQVIVRKKDLPDAIKGSNNSARLIKSYYIKNEDHFYAIKDEVIKLCEVFNARAGINLNKRSFNKNALQTARTILDQIADGNYKSAHRAYNTVCGRYVAGSDKSWILDYDNGIMDKHTFTRLSWVLENCMPIGNKIIDRIVTKHGEHIITKPFNLKEAEYILNEFKLDVHKNNPTVLFIP